MVIGDPGVLGAHVTQAQGKDTDPDLAIIQQPKMEVHPVQGHHQSMISVSYLIGLITRKVIFDNSTTIYFDMYNLNFRCFEW